MTVETIKAAIEQLPEAERRQLADWLAERAQAAWDVEMDHDLSGITGERLFERVNRQIDEGHFAPLDLERSRPRRLSSSCSAPRE